MDDPPQEVDMSSTPFASRQTSPAVGRRSMIRLALLASVAISTDAVVPAHAADSAVEPVERFGTSLVALTQTGGMPFVQRFAQFAPSVDEALDLGSILRTSVGGHWETMNSSDQSDLMRVFREYTIANFVANFDKYKGAFQVTGERDAVGSERVVDSKIGDATLRFSQHPSAWWRAGPGGQPATKGVLVVRRQLGVNASRLQGLARAGRGNDDRVVAALAACSRHMLTGPRPASGARDPGSSVLGQRSRPAYPSWRSVPHPAHAPQHWACRGDMPRPRRPGTTGRSVPMQRAAAAARGRAMPAIPDSSRRWCGSRRTARLGCRPVPDG